MFPRPSRNLRDPDWAGGIEVDVRAPLPDVELTPFLHESQAIELAQRAFRRGVAVGGVLTGLGVGGALLILAWLT
jgi:hypothetical protein